MVHANVCYPSTGRSSSGRISAGFSRKTHEKQGLLERDLLERYLLERASSKQDPLKLVSSKHDSYQRSFLEQNFLAREALEGFLSVKATRGARTYLPNVRLYSSLLV